MNEGEPRRGSRIIVPLDVSHIDGPVQMIALGQKGNIFPLLFPIVAVALDVLK